MNLPSWTACCANISGSSSTHVQLLKHAHTCPCFVDDDVQLNRCKYQSAQSAGTGKSCVCGSGSLAFRSKGRRTSERVHEHILSVDPSPRRSLGLWWRLVGLRNDPRGSPKLAYIVSHVADKGRSKQSRHNRKVAGPGAPDRPCRRNGPPWAKGALRSTSQEKGTNATVRIFQCSGSTTRTTRKPEANACRLNPPNKNPDKTLPMAVFSSVACVLGQAHLEVAVPGG